MSPEVLQRKLEHLSTYLKDLSSFKNCSFNVYQTNRYQIERLLELSIMVAIDIAFHLLERKGEPTPSTYASAILRAGELNVIPSRLANRLAKAAGFRNALAHGYEDLDPKKVHASINMALKDLAQFIKFLERR